MLERRLSANNRVGASHGKGSRAIPTKMPVTLTDKRRRFRRRVVTGCAGVALLGAAVIAVAVSEDGFSWIAFRTVAIILGFLAVCTPIYVVITEELRRSSHRDD